jgi:hypothetical protein
VFGSIDGRSYGSLNSEEILRTTDWFNFSFHIIGLQSSLVD